MLKLLETGRTEHKKSMRMNHACKVGERNHSGKMCQNEPLASHQGAVDNMELDCEKELIISYRLKGCRLWSDFE